MPTRYQPNLRVSEYFLEECIGTGSFGEVWRARHHIWDKERVAIKLPTEPEYVRYLQREGVVVHGLRHPNIVRVLGLDPFADPPYLVMELVDGPSLKDALANFPTGMPIALVANVLRGLLNGVHHAHQAGVLHRDLKPGNVLLHLAGKPVSALRSEDVKIGDFGFGAGARDGLRSIAQSASLARDDGLVGTLAYMAPEIRDGTHEADIRSDLFAVGVMLFEMLTGARPAGAELPSTMRAEVPGAIDDVFQRLYARRERRYESAGAVLDALIRALPGSDSAAAPRRAAPGVVGARSATPTTGHFCHNCRITAPLGDNYCIRCGRQLVTRVPRCNGCGAYPAPGDRFCIQCGAAVALEEA